MLNEIKITDKVSFEEFIARLPPFIAKAYLEINTDNRLLKKLELKYCFQDWVNNITWSRCKSPDFGGNRWSNIHSRTQKILFTLEEPVYIELFIKIDDYFCRSVHYQEVLKDEENEDIFINNLDNFKMEFPQ